MQTDNNKGEWGMDIAKIIFETLDKFCDKSQNNAVVFDGADKIFVKTDVVYNTRIPEPCVLDYYKPDGEGPFPVIFYIHGGGFMAGDKDYRKALGTWFALQGFFAINVNYGLSPDYVFPKPVKHLFSALNWVVRNAEKLNLDLEKITVAGDSAGAYYALVMACVSENENLQKMLSVNPKVSFVASILNCGIYDIKKALDGKFLFDLNKKVFQATTGITDKEYLKYKYRQFCSPINFVTRAYPPTFLFYAEKDLLCKGQAEELIERFDENDIYFESFCSTSVLDNHCFSLDWKNKTAQAGNRMLEDFLLKLKNGDLPRRQSETTIYIRGKK